MSDAELREDRLEEARAEFASRLDYLRESARRKTGLRLARPGWMVLLLSGAVGMALAGRRRKRSEREDPE